MGATRMRKPDGIGRKRHGRKFEVYSRGDRAENEGLRHRRRPARSKELTIKLSLQKIRRLADNLTYFELFNKIRPTKNGTRILRILTDLNRFIRIIRSDPSNPCTILGCFDLELEFESQYLHELIFEV